MSSSSSVNAFKDYHAHRGAPPAVVAPRTIIQMAPPSAYAGRPEYANYTPAPPPNNPAPNLGFAGGIGAPGGLNPGPAGTPSGISVDSAAPLCRCAPGLPAVQRTVKKEGPNTGRIFFACPKEFRDASKCDFFKWADELDRDARNDVRRATHAFPEAPMTGPLPERRSVLPSLTPSQVAQEELPLSAGAFRKVAQAAGYECKDVSAIECVIQRYNFKVVRGPYQMVNARVLIRDARKIHKTHDAVDYERHFVMLDDTEPNWMIKGDADIIAFETAPHAGDAPQFLLVERRTLWEWTDKKLRTTKHAVVDPVTGVAAELAGYATVVENTAEALYKIVYTQTAHMRATMIDVRDLRRELKGHTRIWRADAPQGLTLPERFSEFSPEPAPDDADAPAAAEAPAEDAVPTDDPPGYYDDDDDLGDLAHLDAVQVPERGRLRKRPLDDDEDD